jgi:ClpP class serine protease
MAWFLKPEVMEAMQAGRSLRYQPTLEERARFADQMREAHAARDGDSPRILSVEGDTASIEIDGVLTEKPDCIALLFGGGNTTYEGIRRSLAAAESDPKVTQIRLNISSPGGEVTGLFETLAAIEAVKKPMSVRASLAASAAYGIAAVAGPIEAVTPASEFGSIGVAARMYLDDTAVDIASTEAPRKRPDARTEEGQEMVREELDAFHELFVDSIARGRSSAKAREFTVATVNAEFGRGGVLLAEAAKKRGMIDGIAQQPRRRPTGKRAESEDNEVPEVAPEKHVETVPMNKDQLKAQHPELYASVFEDGKVAGKTEGKAEGEASERKRVLAHLKLGKTTGAMKIAEDAIAAGKSTLDEDVHADYLSASMNRRDVGARQDDAATAAGVLDGAKPVTGSEGAKDLGDEVVALLEQQRGPAKKAS